MKKFISTILCGLCLVSAKPASADVSADELRLLREQLSQLTDTVSRLQSTVESQQREITSLRSQEAISPPASGPSGLLSTADKTLKGKWNPDIGVVADTVLKIDSPKEDGEGADRISVRELELVFGSAIDPYSRLDATVAFSDFEEPHLEEAYVTRFGLPLDVTARFGRFKARIGKAIPVHMDTLDTVDQPLVIQRYFGHHGYSKTGADLLKGFDSPWASHEITFGVLEGGNGEEGALFGSTRRHPTLYGHLKNYWELDETTGLELGVSPMAGSRDEDSSFEVGVIGLDGTLIRRLGDRRHVKLQGEAFRVNRRESFVETTGDADEVFFDDVDDANGLWGSYALLDWRFSPNWATGFRYDNVQPIEFQATDRSSRDQGFTGYLTLHQSEFARWRVQYTHLDLASGDHDNQVLLQGTFAIGEHKHKLQ